jgi:hypothetical protein
VASALTDIPMLRITYRRAKQVKILASNDAMLRRYVKGLLIAADDVQLLTALRARDIVVRLDCPGQPSYQARVQLLLKRLVPVPASEFWYLPITITGPLRESGLPGKIGRSPED